MSDKAEECRLWIEAVTDKMDTWLPWSLSLLERARDEQARRRVFKERIWPHLRKTAGTTRRRWKRKAKKIVRRIIEQQGLKAGQRTVPDERTAVAMVLLGAKEDTTVAMRRLVDEMIRQRGPNTPLRLIDLRQVLGVSLAGDERVLNCAHGFAKNDASHSFEVVRQHREGQHRDIKNLADTSSDTGSDGNSGSE
eukprot:m51a1_g11748 hypothetical protein (194) ;mRNA; f:166128-166872